MKICFLVPDGVGIRNYLYSDLLKHLNERGHEILIWHALAPDVVSFSANLNGFVPKEKKFQVFSEGFSIQLLKESAFFARLKHNENITSNSTIMHNWHEKKGSWQRKVLLHLAEFFGKRIKGYEGITSTEKICFSKFKKTPAYKHYLKDLKEIKPDLLFCTHQRFPGAAYAIEAAKDLEIKTTTAIFSWDNLPKARMAVRPDQYLVWSDYMHKELRYFYPEIEEKCIQVCGTPQFDFYSKTELIQSRNDFAAEFGLNPSKKWVCFSGDDAKTSPHDPEYLRDIAQSLIGQDDIQIIFRQVPIEDTSRYQDVLEQYPQVIHINPFWKKGEHWQQFFPDPKDVAHLVNLAFHCDTVINIGSTMAMDFAFFDKPALYLRYDHYHGQAWSVTNIYQFQHFRSMEGLEPVGWINSLEEILEKVRQAINNPKETGRDRKKWLDRIVQPNSNKSASSQIAAFFESTSEVSLKEAL